MPPDQPFTDTQQQMIEKMLTEAVASAPSNRWQLFVVAAALALVGGGGGLIGGIQASGSARETAILNSQLVREIQADIGELRQTVATREAVALIERDLERVRLRQSNLEAVNREILTDIATLKANQDK